MHSLHCHFDAVAIAVATEADRYYVAENSGLDIYDIIVHSQLPKPSSMGIFTIKELQTRFLTDPRWSGLDFVFYSEADQILHMRTDQVFRPLLPDYPDSETQNVGRSGQILPAMVVPHRFHDVPRAEDMALLDVVHKNDEILDELRTLSRPLRRMEELHADPNLLEFFPFDPTRPSVRRELNLYGSMPLTSFTHVWDPESSCCFVPRGQNQPNYTERRAAANDGTVEMMAVGSGLAMVAGDCCFTCVWANRYCHNTCLPRTADSSVHCGMGAFSD